jgi:sulfonate transport system substrate-binding protein
MDQGTTRRRVLVGGTGLIAASALAACSGGTATTGGTGTTAATGTSAKAGALRVGPLSTQNTLTLTQGSGLLADHLAQAGGSVTFSTPFPAFSPAAEALAAGQVDMSSGSSTALVTALQGDPDLVVFAVEENDGDTQGIVASAGSGITTLAGLAGRSVAVNKGGTGDYLLRTALVQQGLGIEDVEPVYLGPADAATAFSSGQVDAWATWDQFLVTAQQLPGTTTLALARDVGATNRTVHVVSRAYLQADPAGVGAAYAALLEQAGRVRADPSILVDAYTSAGASPDVARALGALTPPTIVPADAAFLTEFQQVADFYAAQGLTPGPTDVTTAVVDASALA